MPSKRRTEHDAAMANPMSDQDVPYDWPSRRNEALRRSGFVCSVCGGSSGLQVHHVTPRAVALDHSISNLRTLCAYCHSAEHGVNLVSSAAATKLKNLNRSRINSIQYAKRKARKDYQCIRCKTPIAKGTFYYCGTGRPGGWYANDKYCERCFLALPTRGYVAALNQRDL